MVDGLPATRKPLHEKVTYIMGGLTTIRKKFIWKGKWWWMAYQGPEKPLHEKVTDNEWLDNNQNNVYMKR